MIQTAENVANDFVNVKPQNLHQQTQLPLMPTQQIAEKIKNAGQQRMKVLTEQLNLIDDGKQKMNQKVKALLNPLIYYSQTAIINTMTFKVQDYRKLSIMPFVCQFYLSQMDYFIDIQDQIDPLTKDFICVKGTKSLYQQNTQIITQKSMQSKINKLFSLYYSKQTSQKMVNQFFRPLLNHVWSKIKEFKYYAGYSQLLDAFYCQNILLPKNIQEVKQYQTSVLRDTKIQNDKTTKTDINKFSSQVLLKTLKKKEQLKLQSDLHFFTVINKMDDIRTLRQNQLRLQIQQLQSIVS